MTRFVLCLTLIAGTHAFVDCDNGNKCSIGHTCVGRHAQGSSELELYKTPTTIVGRKYGCSQFQNASLCPGTRFSCHAAMKCLWALKTGFTCLSSDSKIIVNATKNVHSTAIHKSRGPSYDSQDDDDSYDDDAKASHTHHNHHNHHGGSDDDSSDDDDDSAPGPSPGPGPSPPGPSPSSSFCGIIADDLPSECTCQNTGNIGGIVDCKEDIIADVIGVKGTISPCTNPAKMTVEIYETDAGISVTEGVTAGEEIGNWPVPGLSIDFPGIASAGVTAGLEFKGNADSLTIDGTLDVCGEVPIVGGDLCASDIPGQSEFPVDVISFTENFGDLCGSSNNQNMSVALQ